MNELALKINVDNLSQSEREALMKLVEKSRKPKGKNWKPELTERYYFVSDIGETEWKLWQDDAIDEWHYLTHNCFETIEEAEFALEKAEVESELKNYAEEHNEGVIDWNDDKTCKWFICFNHEDGNSLQPNRYYTLHIPSITYFTSKEILKSAIQEIGEDRIKKYLFGVS